VERIKSGVRDIDARVSKVSQTATRIGDRLQARAAGWRGGGVAAGWVVAARASS
jgi:hypothetical protein